MGVGLGLAIGALVVGVIAAIMFRPSMEGQDMSPATLESFQITTTDEGSVVPWIAGTVRTKTNILWYGNLRSEAITEEAGGKGGGGGEVTTGFKYWMDLWKSICLGSSLYGDVSLVGVYVGDQSKNLSNITYTLNDGTQTSYPSTPGSKANAMKSVAHIWLPQYFLGENVSFVPTFHFIVKCESRAPLTYANLSTGVNPAAKIYDILLASGSQASDFNLASFQTAADYWYNQGYGINVAYTSQKEAREWIAQIFTWVDGCLRKDAEDKWYLQAYDPADASVATLNDEDLIDFSLTRRSWNETYNDFRGNYTDSAQAYTRRTVRVYNGANIRLLGYKRQRTIDLTAFTTAGVASKRLSEIMRRESYPEAQISFSANLAYEEECHVGKVITINNSEYGISNANFRITSREVSNVDSNLLDFAATQVVETLWDDTYEDGGAPGWVEPDYRTADVPLAFLMFELPWTTQLQDVPSYVALCARAGQEDGFLIMYSKDGTDYQNAIVGRVFSQHGTLDEDYGTSVETDSIDDDFGILYTPTREDPVFSSISRAALFDTRRVAIIGDEVMAFQNVTYEGANSIRLTGVIRGVLNSPISSHSAGSDIWLAPLDSKLGNVWQDTTYQSSVYYKFVPKFGSQYVDAALITAKTITREYKGSSFGDLGRIEVIRSGSTCTVLVHHVNTTVRNRAGYDIADNSSDAYFSNDYQAQGLSPLTNWFQHKIGSGGTVNDEIGTRKFDYTRSGAHTLYIQNYYDPIDNWVTVDVGAADGTYIGPVISET